MPQNRGDVHDPVFEIRDPIYGFVKLTGAEIDIINTPTFQRLRDIRQLAMGHMVYPGANHTRFEHSIGCVHVSTNMLELLKEREGKNKRPTFQQAFSADEQGYDRGKKILRLASLLHDVGHPPFSHSGEGLLPEGMSHEVMSVKMIRDTEIAECIHAHYETAGISVEDVIAVATRPSLAKSVEYRGSWNLFLNQILTGELGSDRIDYLLRDAHHSGQMGGKFDYVKLLNAMTVLQQPERDGEAWVLGLDEGGWLVAEQMVVARYMMYVALYFHKTKRIYEIHLEDFMREYLPKRCLPRISRSTSLLRTARLSQRSTRRLPRSPRRGMRTHVGSWIDPTYGWLGRWYWPTLSW